MQTTMPRTEHKGMEYFPCVSEIKERNGAKYQIGGYLAYKNNLDYGSDVIRDGAFAKTLREAYARKAAGDPFLFPYLWSHNQDLPPVGGIYEASEDTSGLYVKVQFNPEIQLSREIFSSFKMKTLSKQSVGYIAEVINWMKGESGKNVRELLGMDVREGSATLFPMNPLATVDSVKSGHIWSGYSAEVKEGRVMSQRTVAVLSKAVKGISAHVNDIEAHLNAARMNSGVGFPMYSASSSETYDIASAVAELNDMLEGKAGRMMSAETHTKIATATMNIAKHAKIIRDSVNEASRYNALAGTPVYHASSDETYESKEDPAITELRALRMSLTGSTERTLESRMDEIDCKIGVDLALAALLASE